MSRLRARAAVGSVSLHEHIERLDGLRRSMASRRQTDSRQNDRIDALENEVVLLAGTVTALLELLRDKGVCSAAEITAAIDRASADAKAADAARAAAELEQVAASVRRAQKRRRDG